MALSNTAVPKYYGMFRDAVLRGDIIVNSEVSLEMFRIDRLIEDPDIWYDDEAIDGFIHFCEGELVLTDGSNLNLLDSFKLWSEQIFGWYKFVERKVYRPNRHGHGGHYVSKWVKKRLIHLQYIITARGSAKSMYAACLHAYFLTVDNSTTHQVATAPTMRQAEEVLSPIRTAITKSRGPFFKFLTYGSLQNTTGSKANRVQLASTKKGIQDFLTNSLLEVLPMTVDKLQGLQLKFADVDEWLSGDTHEDVIEALIQGATKEQSSTADNDYLILAISSEGTVRNGVGDSIKMDLTKILRGEKEAEDVSIWWYKLDDPKEVGDPDMWIKANPNIGITVSYDTYHQAVHTAETTPSKRNDILAKRFGLPMAGFTYYFTYEETKPFRFRENAYWGMSCAMGVDLSQGDDFCAFTFLFPQANEEFGIKVHSYISELTFHKLPMALRLKYEEFQKEGSLVVMPGAVLDMMLVYDDIDEFIANCDYTVCCLGYDPYNAKDFIERWDRENGSYGVVKVPQGARTETVPLGELKKLASERMLIFDEALMSYCMGNCITMEDTNGNKKLLKKRHEAKIDNVAALVDAYVAYKQKRECFD